MKPSKLLWGRVFLGGAALALVACETTPAGPEIGDAPAPLADDAPVSKTDDARAFGPLGEAGSFAVFAPDETPTRSSEIDYSIISDALDVLVFRTGPSLRTVARPRNPEVGTRFVRGHDSQLRLEGNKVFLSQVDDATEVALKEYTDSLVAIGNNTDLTAFSRNEQLAYWFNLHNMLVITNILEEYPVQVPSRMRVGSDGEFFHDAKLTTIKGVDLSLRDIRRNIVFRYWDDPRVMYGFWHGDLGSPNIQDQAFSGNRVVGMLESNAREFVNSLRGVRDGRSRAYVSKHYFEARAGLFPNWPVDLKRHLAAFADEDVQEIIAKHDLYVAGQYETRTADLVGGDPRPSIQSGPTTLGIPPQFAELAGEVGDKIIELRRRGKISARVIILDVDDEEDEDPNPELD